MSQISFLGIALGFKVWIAVNDRNRPYGDLAKHRESISRFDQGMKTHRCARSQALMRL